MEHYIPLTSEMLEKYESQPPEYEQVRRSPVSPERYVKTGNGSFRYEKGQKEQEAVISCVGDMLCEEKLYKAHHAGNDFFFHDIFQFVRPLFRKTDLVIGNLETTICESAPYTGEQYKIGGKYHCNAPVEFLDAIKQAGFDFLVMSNNHNCDSGVNGLLETLYHVDQRGLMHTGAFTPQETKRWTIIDVNGIKLAILAYSTWFNRNEGKFTELGRQQILNAYRADRAAEDIRAARADGAEFVIVYMHWGVDAEYKHQQSPSMQKMAQELADCGADYIVGTHTHSIQPHTILQSADGRSVPCIYSLGNFVTSELAEISRKTAVLQIKLRRENGAVAVREERLIPCYVPDHAFGISYPIVPANCIPEDKEMLEKIKKKYHEIRDVVGESLTGGHFLTADRVCSILGVPNRFGKQNYTTVEYAIDAKPGCIALVWQSAFDPYIPTTPARCAELADLAMKKGAKLLITNEQIKDYPCIVVDGYPFDAFSKIVAAIRRRFNPITISVTGSIGKTSTTGMVDAVLGYKYKTFGNLHNANSARFSAKLIQQLDSKAEVYVQETMETPPYGLAGMISKMVQPQIAIVTVVGTSHMKALGSQERILETCMSVQEGMPEDGLLILNGDDPFQRKAVPVRKAVYYGIDNPDVDYRAVNIRGQEDCLLFDIQHDGIVTPAKLYCFGKHNVLNALASFAAGKRAGMSDEEIVAGLARFRTADIRQNLVIYGGYRLFMDCYNAASESMASAMEALATMPVSGKGRRIAVLADIKETGEKNDEIHQTVGRLVAKAPVDLLICYGESAKIIAETARSLSEIPIYHTESDAELERLLKENITPEDVTLFKGSRGMALERFVDRVFGTWFYESDEDAIAKAYTKADDQLQYRVYPDHATVIAKVTSGDEVMVPDFVDGKPVTGIDRSVFTRSRSYTRSIRLPNSLKNIRYCAFYKVSRLESVLIPSGVRIIDTSAFSTCERLREVTIEEGCTHLGYRAFGNCRNLERITIPATVRQIGGEAFLNCEKLTIYGAAGSYAERYAGERKIPFVRTDA